MTTSESDAAESSATRTKLRSGLTRVALAIGITTFVVFWTWALFFASKEAVNKIDDRAWAVRAQIVCEEATVRRESLADFRPIREASPELIVERARIVDESTDILATMLDEVVAVEPTDPKGQSIVPLWEDEYRTYLGDRRNYADQLRESGENLPFFETEVGLPISERLETFAADNEMAACAPPRDLSR